MREHVLTGLNASNPLAFMAALGVFRIADEAFRGVRLLFRDEGRWRPVLQFPDEAPCPVDLVCADLASWRTEKGQVTAPELSLEYEKTEKDGDKVRVKIVRDLKPRPEDFRAFLKRGMDTFREDPERVSSRRWAAFAAAFAAEGAVDYKGNTKPTAFHFTAGQQAFLGMVSDLAVSLTREHVEEALLGPWKYAADLPMLRWDVTGERLYALMASDPTGSQNKAKGVPGADWLAFQALPFFPVFQKGKKARTVSFSTEPGSFVFPVWTVPVSLSTVRSLLMSNVASRTPFERRLMGIAAVFSSAVKRNDKGYGNFSAAVPA